MRPLRTYLLTLVVGAALPLVLLSALQVRNAGERQRAVVEAGLVETSRALARTVEQELLSSIAALKILAASPHLARGDMEGFRQEAHAAARQMRWSAAWLADAKGQQLFNSIETPGSALPWVGDRVFFQEVLRTRRPVVSGLLMSRVSGRPVVIIAVPQLELGKSEFVVGATLLASVFDEILVSVNQQLRSATAAVVDRDFVLVGRNRDASRFVGQRAHESYVEIVRKSSEGVARTGSLDGGSVYVAFRRLPLAGWTVGMGVAASEVEGPMRRAMWTAAAISAAVLLVATGLAVLLGRRITGPMRALSAFAEAIARGEPCPLPPTSGIREVDALGRTLRSAAEATRERNHYAQQARRITAELEAAEIRERQQIARDLHDDLSQTLAAVQIRLGRLRQHEDAAVRSTAVEVSGLVERANRSTRSLAEQLAPPVLYELGLVPALHWLAQLLHKDYGLEVEVEDDGLPKPLAPEAASIVFRCLRELLINVARHAKTHAAHVRLEVQRDGDMMDGDTQKRESADIGSAGVSEGGGEKDTEGAAWLVIHVVDGGCGFEWQPPAAGAGKSFGLMAVKERIAYLGGSFHVSSVPGDGTLALLSLPLQPVQRPASHEASEEDPQVEGSG